MGTTMQKEYIIRKMLFEDVKGVFNVERDSFSVPWPPEMFEEEVKNPLAKYLVLESSGTICGYAGFWLVIGEAQVTNIALLKEYRGKGYGKILIEALLDLAINSQADTIVLEVRKSNLVAQKLYEKYGFSPRGIRERYYIDNNEDAVLMQKDLGVNFDE